MPDLKISRNEIDLRRLLVKCEEMSKETDVAENWRLPKVCIHFIQTYLLHSLCFFRIRNHIMKKISVHRKRRKYYEGVKKSRHVNIKFCRIYNLLNKFVMSNHFTIGIWIKKTWKRIRNVFHF